MNQLSCPACEKPLSLWNVAKAPTPFHLKCDHCRTKLGFERHVGWITFAIALVFGMVVGFAAADFGIDAVIIALILGVVVFEVAMFLIGSAMNLKLTPREKA